MQIIDLSYSIEEGIPVFPGDNEITLKQNKFFLEDGYNNFEITFGMHVGTHIDGPMHLTESKKYISGFPLEKFMGEAIVIDVLDQKEICFQKKYEEIIKKEQIVLFYTGHDKKFGNKEYFEDYPVFEQELADFLVCQKVKLIGIDSPSPDKYPFSIHKTLLEKDILIVENLINLDKVINASKIEFFAIPLKIKADSSPVRAFANTFI